MFTETLKERQSLTFATTTTINSGGTASLSTTAQRMDVLRRVRAYFLVGSITGGGALTLEIQSSATSGGSYASVTGLTTLPKTTGQTTQNKLYCIELRSDQLPSGQVYVKGVATETGGQNCTVSIVMIADEASYKPGNQFSGSTPQSDIVAAV